MLRKYVTEGRFAVTMARGVRILLAHVQHMSPAMTWVQSLSVPAKIR